MPITWYNSKIIKIEDQSPTTKRFWAEVEDVDETVRSLQEAGLTFDELPELKRWLWQEARLRDPDGNRVIIYYAGDNRKNPPWRLKQAE